MAHEKKLSDIKIDQNRGYLKTGPKLKKFLKGSKPILRRGYGGPEEGWKQTARGMHIPADLAPEKKSIKVEKLMRDAIAKNPEAKTLISKLRKLLPGLTGQTVLFDMIANPGTAHAPTTASQDTIEKVAQFMYDNGGRWPDKVFKEGFRGDPAASMSLYQSMVEENVLRKMSDDSDMRTKGNDKQWYTPEQQETLRERQEKFMLNLAQQTNSGQ